MLLFFKSLTKVKLQLYHINMSFQLLRLKMSEQQIELFQTIRHKLQLLCHQKSWGGSRGKPANTRPLHQVIPGAAAAEMVIYCRGINKTSVVPFTLQSVPSLHLLTYVSTIPQREEHRSELEPRSLRSACTPTQTFISSLQLQVSEPRSIYSHGLIRHQQTVLPLIHALLLQKHSAVALGQTWRPTWNKKMNLHKTANIH